MGEILLCRIHPNHSPMFSGVLHSHMTPFHPFRPNSPQHPPVSVAFLPHSHISSTPIISITDTLCPGYHGTILEPFRQSRNIIGSITDTFRHLYHLDHASTLKEVSVLCLLFQSLLLLHTSPFSCSIKRTRYLVNIPQFVINVDPSEYYPSA